MREIKTNYSSAVISVFFHFIFYGKSIINAIKLVLYVITKKSPDSNPCNENFIYLRGLAAQAFIIRPRWLLAVCLKRSDLLVLVTQRTDKQIEFVQHFYSPRFTTEASGFFAAKESRSGLS